MFINSLNNSRSIKNIWWIKNLRKSLKIQAHLFLVAYEIFVTPCSKLSAMYQIIRNKELKD